MPHPPERGRDLPSGHPSPPGPATVQLPQRGAGLSVHLMQRHEVPITVVAVGLALNELDHPSPHASVVLVDDVRSFRDGRRCHVARTATTAIEVLRRLRDDTITQLWLDHDLGTDRHTGHALTIMPVVNELVQAAEAGQAYRIDTLMIHTANPRGAVLMRRALESAGYTTTRWYDTRIWISTRTEEDRP